MRIPFFVCLIGYEVIFISLYLFRAHYAFQFFYQFGCYGIKMCHEEHDLSVRFDGMCDQNV